ncbi:hypothetical protein B0H67DRAFT_594127 [Lasiosphaeris hirsuta]|uniref:Uncharacterized protein n=1 Tax=Lasiosphaeris hirsuta TaxID=260670 RepID=A0AA39ZXI3_9PEZI|nr:hypothetical protein B0H67DRAFT_594127 [Lasiosphaeris hirsuta]
MDRECGCRGKSQSWPQRSCHNGVDIQGKQNTSKIAYKCGHGGGSTHLRMPRTCMPCRFSQAKVDWQKKWQNLMPFVAWITVFGAICIVH